MPLSTARQLENHEVGELYRRYQPLQGKDQNRRRGAGIDSEANPRPSYGHSLRRLGGSAQPSAAGLQDYREEWEDHQNTNR